MTNVQNLNELREQFFGYHPDYENVHVALHHGTFARALVIETPVKSLVDGAANCRILWNPEVALPEGLYWFCGIPEGPMLLQVGLGDAPADAMLTPVDTLTDDHPLMNAWRWAEILWESAIHVPHPQFAVQESVLTRQTGMDAVVRDRKFAGNRWSYTVWVDGRVQDVVETGLVHRPEQDGPRSWVATEPTPAARFSATLTRAKLKGKFSNTLFSFRATRTTFRPYQFKPVLKLLQTGKAHLLIADEVGLGKTIEAGLIWTELEARHEANSVLIVCPSSLVGKWKEEMEDRFEFSLTELDGTELQKFLERHRANRLPERHAYICSLERLRAWPGIDALKDSPPTFDLVIVDEAHSMRNSDTKSYALGTEVTGWADSVVFLTATPMNLRQEDLLNLLELLAPGDFGDINDLELRLEPNKVINAVGRHLIENGTAPADLLKSLQGLRSSRIGATLMDRPEFALLTDTLSKDVLSPRDVVDAKRYLADLNTLSTVITRTKKVEVDDRKAKRTEERRQVHWTHPEQTFYKEYLAWCRQRAAEVGRPLHFAMQMPLRLASACLPMARRAVLDPYSFGAFTDADSGESLLRVEPHDELIDAALQLPEGLDTKLDQLRAVLYSLHQQKRQALLFTHSRPTLAYLSSKLSDDYRIALLHGDVPRKRRREIMAEFRNGNFDFVFANRVASEGLDFEFCSAVINYDLPWNPMEIEQRIGRIDRIGQKEEAILVVNFVNEETIDERIISRLLDRIEIFESSIGPLEPIIAANAPRALKAGFDFTLSAKQREQKIIEVLTALEEQKAGLQDVADSSSSLLISNDVDVAGLEDELVRTGRYIGQRELALLLADWTQIDQAPVIKISPDGQSLELRGNARMASRVDALNQSARRTRAETGSLSAQLRSELPIHLVLDQELARTGGGALLTATSPLVMAAVNVPGHQQARFASLQLLTADPGVESGTYVIVLAKAVSASRGGDEIWGAAVSDTGRHGGDGPVNAVLAALADGTLEDAPLPDIERLPQLADRALNELHRRHDREQDRRDREFSALQETRLVTQSEQHKRRLVAIRKRVATAEARGRDPRMIALFQSQITKAEERFSHLSQQIADETQPEIRLEALAACVITIARPKEEK
ncbi:helicase-related protein [Pseudarthrobacter sp. BRE9]|uniref:helicase-related protein n=1 Tax=Pseudarthrobacter sp. BRE9 TaxID=2962582 RepID=UPI0028826EF5|nr:helicase-related protein [Pseudarthrobacter sp. BRE9]MDT0169737.1 helicase-related protein [Pseudarthrobacter sp. BRE9]